jgi:hypothetical protein
MLATLHPRPGGRRSSSSKIQASRSSVYLLPHEINLPALNHKIVIDTYYLKASKLPNGVTDNTVSHHILLAIQGRHAPQLKNAMVPAGIPGSRSLATLMTARASQQGEMRPHLSDDFRFRNECNRNRCTSILEIQLSIAPNYSCIKCNLGS